jgi:hypothetical protein
MFMVGLAGCLVTTSGPLDASPSTPELTIRPETLPESFSSSSIWHSKGKILFSHPYNCHY